MWLVLLISHKASIGNNNLNFQTKQIITFQLINKFFIEAWTRKETRCNTFLNTFIVTSENETTICISFVILSLQIYRFIINPFQLKLFYFCFDRNKTELIWVLRYDTLKEALWLIFLLVFLGGGVSWYFFLFIYSSSFLFFPRKSFLWRLGL